MLSIYAQLYNGKSFANFYVVYDGEIMYMKNLLKSFRMKYLLLTKYRGLKMGENSYIAKGTHLRPKLITIGDHVSIGRYCQFGAWDVRIGDYVLIGSYVGIVEREAHDPYIVGRPFMFTNSVKTATNVKPTIIEDDVWVGFGAIILSGITIGTGSIVASGSIVVDDVPPYSIVASPKAKIISNRFDEHTKEEHEKLMNRNYGVKH